MNNWISLVVDRAPLGRCKYCGESESALTNLSTYAMRHLLGERFWRHGYVNADGVRTNGRLGVL